MTRRHSRTVPAAAAFALALSGLLTLGPAAASAADAASVTIAGSLDSELGCSSDWQPDCAAAHLTLQSNGVWSKTFKLPAGSYEYKAALNDSWDVSYGLGGGGGNVPLVLAAAQDVTFYFDPVSHWVTDSVSSTVVTAAGNFQTFLGCSANAAPECRASWLQDLDGNGTYTLSTAAIPAGTYAAKAFLDFASTTSYGAGGAAGGADISFTVPATGGGATTTFSFNATTHVLTITSTPLVQVAATTFSHPTARRGDVMVNLFEWNWKSVAKECTTVLGPAGYGGVQVSPPQNSFTKAADPVHPWWEVYQPVSYALTSRMGTEAQFKAMVKTCRAAGLKVYVDVVINHMTGGGGPSYGGTTVTKYEYPGLYTASDFHTTPKDCPRAGGVISDFTNYTEVTKCELVGLSDLRTETTKVRDTVAAYLNKLLAYGVSGFRVDAAKHMGQADLAAIKARLHRTVDGTPPFYSLEVTLGGPGRLNPWAFLPVGTMLGFDYSVQVRDAFNSGIHDLKVFGEPSGLLPSGGTVAFVANHDSERNGETLSYKSGATYTLATEFMLAYGYGMPQVYSGFAFSNRDQSPPADANGYITDANCTNGWACTHRSMGIVNMVDWHNYAGSAAVRHWYDNGANLIAFSRGSRAWIAINNGTTAQKRTFMTGLPAGTYCDIIHGSFQPTKADKCTGPTVRVSATGRATVTVGAKDSVAFDAGDRL